MANSNTKHTINLTSDGSGDGTYSLPLHGFIESIQYIKDGTNPYADTLDIYLTVAGVEVTVATNATASATYRPETGGSKYYYCAVGDAVTLRIDEAGDSNDGQFIIRVVPV